MIGYGVNKGIVPITLNEIFNRIATNKGKDIEYEVNASILEIYNEEIQDLTIPRNQRVEKGLKVIESNLFGVYVEGVKKHFVTSFK
jgi:kinesin family protein 1